MLDESGQSVSSVGPSMPVSILGLSGTPNAGDEVQVLDDERKARELAEYRHSRSRDVKLAQQQAGKLDDVFSQLASGESQSVQLLVKADVHGSAEALRDSLEKLSNDEVQVNVIGSGVGGITESDVTLAAASKAPIVGFNVRANSQAKAAAEREGLEIRYYSVIYDLIDDIKAAMSGLLSPEIRETFLGNAEILEIFSISKVGKVAGCRVTEGRVVSETYRGFSVIRLYGTMIIGSSVAA